MAQAKAAALEIRNKVRPVDSGFKIFASKWDSVDQVPKDVTVASCKGTPGILPP